MQSIGNSFRDPGLAANSLAEISTFAAAVTSGVTSATYSFFTLPGQILSSSKTAMRLTWKLIKHSLYYGLIIHISIIQAKALLCRLCQQILNRIKPANFWIVMGLVAVLFMLVNIQIARYLRNRWFSSRRKWNLANFRLRKLSKKTRSGRIYGYM